MHLKAILPQLHYFALVSRYRSFTRAAQRLNISQSAVSYQIKKLEDTLGVQLLIRQPGNQTELTPQGELLADTTQQVFTLLEARLADLSGQTISGSLTISTDTCFGTFAVAPAIGALKRRYPQLKIEVDLNEKFIDLASQNVDVAIRSSTRDPSLEYQPLCRSRMVLVASPAYLAARSPIRVFDDLSQHQVLRTGEVDFDWGQLARMRSEVDLAVLGNTIDINNIFALTQAMLGGAGVAYLSAYQILQALREGAVREVLPPLTDGIFNTYYLAYSPRAEANEKIRAFVGGLVEQLRQPELADGFDFHDCVTSLG